MSSSSILNLRFVIRKDKVKENFAPLYARISIGGDIYLRIMAIGKDGDYIDNGYTPYNNLKSSTKRFHILLFTPTFEPSVYYFEALPNTFLRKRFRFTPVQYFPVLIVLLCRGTNRIPKLHKTRIRNYIFFPHFSS